MLHYILIDLAICMSAIQVYNRRHTYDVKHFNKACTNVMVTAATTEAGQSICSSAPVKVVYSVYS